MSTKQSILVAGGLLIFIALGLSQPVDSFLRQNLSRLTANFARTNLSHEEARELVRDAQINNLQAENDTLRDAAELATSSSYQLVTSRVIARSNSSFISQVVIDVGEADSISQGNVVLADGIVIGTVSNVSRQESTVTLIDDQQFRLQVEFAGHKGVVKGSINGAIIDRVLPEAEVLPGALVVTLPQAENIPGGLPIGRVVGKLTQSDDIFQRVQIAGYDKPLHTSIVQVITK